MLSKITLRIALIGSEMAGNELLRQRVNTGLFLTAVQFLLMIGLAIYWLPHSVQAIL